MQKKHEGDYCKLHNQFDPKAITTFGCYHSSTNRPEVLKLVRNREARGVYAKARKVNANRIITFVDDYTVGGKFKQAIPIHEHGFGFFFNASDTPNCIVVSLEGRLCIQTLGDDIDEGQELTISPEDREKVLASCKAVTFGAAIEPEQQHFHQAITHTDHPTPSDLLTTANTDLITLNSQNLTPYQSSPAQGDSGGGGHESKPYKKKVHRDHDESCCDFCMKDNRKCLQKRFLGML